MSDVIELIGVLVWPAVVVTLLILFRTPVRNALEHATQLRIAGQEIHIARERIDTLDALIQRMEQAEKLQLQTVSPAVEQRILDRAQSDGLLALDDVVSSIRRSVDMLALSNGWVDDLQRGPAELWYGLLQVHRLAGSSPETLPVLFLFAELQDPALKGALKLEQRDMLRLVRGGLNILSYLQQVPLRTNTVVESGLPVFRDEGCTQRVLDIGAMLIRRERPGAAPEERVWPSSLYYTPGTRVSWIFDDSSSWGPCWWRSTETSEAIQVWTGTRYSFVGKPMPD